jgi:NAD(P)-dependent dehydrogenase (short-subunit alcohol dehydrogenase family)
MSERVAILTNVLDYAGPPAAKALAADGFRTLCHSPSFSDAGQHLAFERENPGRVAAAAQTPEALVAEAIERFGRIDVAISNDAANPLTGPIEERTAADYRTLVSRCAMVSLTNSATRSLSTLR